MGEQQRILIADNDSAFCQLLELKVMQKKTCEVELASDGRQALQMAERFQPQIVVLSLTLPQIDGLTVVKLLRQKQPKIKILLLTAFVSDFMLQTASHPDIDYIMMKPCSVQAVTERICQMQQWNAEYLPRNVFVSLPEQDSADLAAQALQKINVPIRVKGFDYLKTAILAVLQNPSLMRAITTKLYPQVAVHHATTDTCVERAMRRAIELAWAGPWSKEASRFLQGLKLDKEKKPSNGQLILCVADFLRQGQQSRSAEL